MDPLPPSSPKKSALRLWAFRLLRVIALAYLGLAIVIYSLQTWMIYPGKSSQGTAQATVHPLKGDELVHLTTSGGEHIVALFGPALNANGKPRDDSAMRPTILFFYGNGENVAASDDLFRRFRRLGCNVLIPEYVGYGMSSGSPSEKGVYQTADAAYAYLLTRKDVDPKRLVVIGRSLGAAAAIDLAVRKPVAALATFSAFTSLPDMARKLMPIFPTSLLLRDRFENEQKLPKYTGPYFLAHGTKDDLVPFKMAARLAAATKGPVTRVDVTGGTHNDIMDLEGTHLFEKLGAFIEQTAGKDAE